MWGSSKGLEDTLLQLKMAEKHASRAASNAEAKFKKQRTLVKDSLSNNRFDIAQIHAENATRLRNEQVNYLRLSARMSAIASRVQSAVMMKGVVRNIGGVTRELEKALSSNNLAKISEIMEKFEKQFQDVSIQSECISNSVQDAFTLSAPVNEVNQLMKEVAEENGLELTSALSDMPSIPNSVESSRAAEDDALSRRLARLRE